MADLDKQTRTDGTSLVWVARLPFWRHRQLWQQLALALGLPLVLLLLFLLLLEWPPSVALLAVLGRVAFVVGGILLVLLALALLVVYAGGYQLEYHLDARGIGSRPHGKTARKNLWLNRSLIILGTLAGRPGAVGAGMLAQGHQREYVAWHQVARAQPNAQQHTITLYGRRQILMVIACEEDDYERVWEHVQDSMKNS